MSKRTDTAFKTDDMFWCHILFPAGVYVCQVIVLIKIVSPLRDYSKRV